MPKQSDAMIRQDIVNGLLLLSLLVTLFVQNAPAWDYPKGDYASYVLFGRFHDIGYQLSRLTENPLFCIYLHFFEVLTKSAILGFYCQVFVALLLATAVLYGVLRSKIHPAISFLLTGLFLFRYFQRPESIGNTQYLFPMIFICLFLIFAIKNRNGYREAALVTLGVGIFFRPELVLVFLGYGAFLILLYLRKKTSARAAVVSGIVVILFLIPVLHSLPFLAKRSRLAFAQHFAVGYMERNHRDGNPWIEYPDILSGLFGSGDVSLPQAFLSNPKAIVEHMAANFILVLKKVPASFFGIPPGIFYSILGISILWLSIFIGKNRYAPPSMVYIFPLLLFGSCIVLFPFDHLILPILPLLYLGIGKLLESLSAKISRRWIFLFSAGVICAMMVNETVKPPQKIFRPLMEIAQKLNQPSVLNHMDPESTYNLLSHNPPARELCALIDRICVPVETWQISSHQNLRIDDFVNRHRIDLIFYNDELETMFSDADVTLYPTRLLTGTNSGNLVAVIRIP